MNEKKTLNILIKKLQRENEKLKENQLDYKNWKNWDTNDVFKFIVNIFDDNRLDEYIDSIKDDIFSSEYTGKDLVEMDLMALKVMGIKNIKIRRDILKSVQKLISNNYNNNDYNMNNDEGTNIPTAYLYH